MSDYPWTLLWIKRFAENPSNQGKRFKRLATGYPPFDIDKTLVDVVGLDEFVKIEPHRLPLFIGSQFGINPKIHELPQFFNGEKPVAILGKSMLSGAVGGLSIYLIQHGESSFTYNKIEYYENR